MTTFLAHRALTTPAIVASRDATVAVAASASASLSVPANAATTRGQLGERPNLPF